MTPDDRQLEVEAEFSSADSGVLAIDSNLVVTSWDDWLASRTGLPSTAVCGRPLLEVFPDTDPRKVAIIREVLEEGTPRVLSSQLHGYLLRMPARVGGGQSANMQQHVTIAPIGESDRVAGAVILIRDVTDRSVSDSATAAALMVALGDDDWRVRRAAVDALTRQPSSEAVESMLRALEKEHRDPALLNSALQVLSMLDLDVLPALERLLREDDAELRMYIALAMGEMGDPRAIPHLLSALDDPDLNVRYHVIEALGRLKAVEAVEPLAHIAESEDFFLAFPALEALRAIGDPYALERMAALLENALLRDVALEALAEAASLEVIPVLTRLLDSEASAALAVSRTLHRIWERYEDLFGEGGQISDAVSANIGPEGTRHLIGALMDSAPEDAAIVMKVLSWVRGQEAESALIRFLQERKVEVPLAEAVARLGERLTPTLLEMLDSDDSQERRVAVEALGRIGSKRAVSRLLDLLATDENVAASAADALARIGDPSAFESLFAQIGHRDPEVREAVIGALNSLGHPSMERRVKSGLVDADALVRESAVRIAGYFGFRSVRRLFLNCTEDPDENVRAAAVEHLPLVLGEEASGELRRRLSLALADDSSTVRAAAARGAALSDDPEVHLLLVPAGMDPDPWVRYYVCRSLGRTRPPGGADVLLRLAREDLWPPVRVAAAEGLAHEQSQAAVETLLDLARSPEADVAITALHALGRSQAPSAEGLLKEVARSPELRRATAAVTALRHFPTETTVDLLVRIAGGSQESSLVSTAIGSLAAMGTEEAVASLLGLAAVPALRGEIIQTLVQLGSSHAAHVGAGLADPRPLVRDAAIEVLLRMKHPLATEMGLAGLSDSDAQVRMNTIRLLSTLGSSVDRARLERLARHDSDPRVRLAASRLARKS